MTMIVLPLGWFEGIVPLVVLLISFLVWLVNQLNAKNEQQKQPQQRQQPRRQRPRAGAGPRPPQAAGPAPERQVEDFLRRVLEQPARPPGPLPRQPGAETVVAAEVVDSPLLGGQGVAQHVDVYLQNDEFQSRAAALTRLDEVDEQVESHIHQVFDHELSNLGAGTVAPPADDSAKLPPATGAAAGVALMLSSPDSLRNAIIMQEVLRRPDFD